MRYKNAVGAIRSMMSEETVAKTDYTLDDAIGHLLRRAYQCTSSRLIALIGEYDITPVQFATLARLTEHGATSQNRLGRLVDVEPGNFHGVVNRLVKRGLIEKMDDPVDKRMILLSLTDEGTKLAEKLIPVSQQHNENMLAPLTKNQRTQLYQLLHRIIDSAG